MNSSAPVTRARRPLLLSLVRAVGWLVLIIGLVGSAAEWSDVAERQIERELTSRVEALGSKVNIGRVHIDWLGPGLMLEDLRIKQDGRVQLEVQSLYVAAKLPWREGSPVKQIQIDGGQAVVSEAFIENVRALLETTEQTGVGSGEGLFLPSVQVRNFQVHFEVPGNEESHLGRIDLSMPALETTAVKIAGRVVLPGTRDSDSPVEVFLSGLVEPSGGLELHALADELDVEAWDISALVPWIPLESLGAKGKLSLHTTGKLSLTGSLDLTGDVRVRVADGALLVPGTGRAAEDIAFNLYSRFEPEDDEDFWVPEAWIGSGSLKARWDGQQLNAGIRLGESARPGAAFESWVNAPDFDLQTAGVTSLESPELVPTIYDAFAPRGRVNATVGITCADTIRPGEAIWHALELTARVVGRGELQAAYHGWRESPDMIPLSFSMETRVPDVQVVYAHTKRFPRHNLIDVRFEGRHASGPVRGSYQQWSNPIDMPPFAPGYGFEEADLFITVPGISIDEVLDEKLAELWEIPELVTLFDDYGLGGGNAKAELRLCSRSEMPESAVLVEVDAHGAQAALAEFPVPVDNMKARIVVIVDGLTSTGVSFEATGDLDSARSLRVSGRVRSESLQTETPPLHGGFDFVDVRVNEVDLQGSDLSVAKTMVPEAIEAVEQFSPRGTADVHYVRSSLAGENVRNWAEVTPGDQGLTLRPQVFPMLSEDVRGRVLVDVSSPPVAETAGEPLESLRTSTRIAPLIATWRGSIPVAFHGEFTDGEDATGKVIGAGLSPADKDLLHDLVQAMESDPDVILAQFEAFEFSGSVDFDYSFRLQEDAEEPEDLFHFRLRGNDCLQENGLDIEHLQGTLELHNDELRSPELTALIAGSEVDLEHFSLMLGEQALMARADLSADSLEIEAELLSQFLEEETVSELTKEFGLRGTLDLDHCSLTLLIDDDEDPRLTLSGEATLSDAYAAIKVPISIRSARLDLQQLTIQGSDVRGWGRVEDLYGQVAERDLAQVGLTLSNHGSQFTISSIDGLLCRGRLGGLLGGEPEVLTEPVLSIDLLSPFRFQTAVAIQDLDVGLLLDNVFSSEIADQGLLTGQVRLRGEFDDLFGVSGSGYGKVTRTALWSVPVARDLFGQLGFDDSAVFDEMESEFRVANGEIVMEGMRVHSPLLNLRGAGTLGFDGTLNHNLEITYSLVDKTGPFRALIYWLQNNLLAISIRGDMSRPKIIPLGLFSSPFVSENDPWRALPSPGFSKLPRRF